jgi:hypothetical protein
MKLDFVLVLMSTSSDVRYPIGRFNFKNPYRAEHRPMYKIVAIVCSVLLFSTAASAQRFNAFIGYSHSGYGPNVSQVLSLFAGSPGINSRHNLNGWNASLEAKVLPILGIVADFSGHYGNETTGLACFLFVRSCEVINANVSLYTFSAGPQVSLRLGRFEPYAHALFDGALYRVSPLTDTSFADVLGGGINVSVIPWIAWRVQADAIQTRFSFGHQNSLRLPTGLVFRF